MRNLWQPRRPNRFAATVALMVGGMLIGFHLLVEPEACGQPPELSRDLPYHIAGRHPIRKSGRFPNFGELLESQRSQLARHSKPHPAVARIIVPEGAVTAYGSGTLVDVRDRYGLVITNWHVVHDASGAIEVVFPDGFRSQARALKVDPDWDLAALVIWRPSVEPVTLASTTPRPGDRLTIHGYGKGKYRVATGSCTQYYAPRPNYPQEMVELDVEARQGDSGGPIFNNHGELAGVLFGAGQGTTIGSFGRRVESFLATLAPDIGRPEAGAMIAASPGLHAERELDAANLRRLPACPGSCCPPSANSPREPSPGTDQFAARTDASPWQAASQDQMAEAQVSTDSFAISDAAKPRAGGIFDHTKSLLAIVGLFTVCVQIVRVVT